MKASIVALMAIALALPGAPATAQDQEDPVSICIAADWFLPGRAFVG